MMQLVNYLGRFLMYTYNYLLIISLSMFSTFNLKRSMYSNSDPLALRHNFMNIDEPAGTSRMSDKCVHFNIA